MSKVIVSDTREQRNAEVLRYLEVIGQPYVVRKVEPGDYIWCINGEDDYSTVIDLKKDLVRTVPGEEPAADDFAHLVTIKAPWGGEVLISTIMLYNTLPEELGGATGIKNVNVANDAVVATFNAAGAKVAANAKGLVIKKFQNGKVVKVMNK